MLEIDSNWRNPPAVIRTALVAGVFAALGVMGGLYVDLLPWFRIDPTSAEIIGAVLLAPVGAWLEASDGRSF